MASGELTDSTMIRRVLPKVWAFDLEWVPDAAAGRTLLVLPPDLGEREVFEAMWAAAGATGENPQPYLKPLMCRVASAAMVERVEREAGPATVRLCSLPKAGDLDEAQLVATFLTALGEHRPQLVGFNSVAADLRVLVQRGMLLGVRAPGFCEQPQRPWEGPNYFYPNSEWNVDLMRLTGGGGRSAPALRELAALAGIPAKTNGSGDAVAEMWLRGEHDRIVSYNECDAVTTYLVWLRSAHFAGCFTTDEYLAEQGLAEDLLEREGASKEHLADYLDRWREGRRQRGDLRALAAAG